MTSAHLATGAELFEAEFAEHISVAEATRARMREAYLKMLGAWIACISSGGKILFFGNGGSAADAQHLACELVVRYRCARRPIAAIALTADASILTAGGNDLGFEHIFSRQIEALGQPGDLALGISTSGRSPNVLAALKTARARGLVAAGLSGNGSGQMEKVADPVIAVPSSTTARIQEMHMMLGHMLCLALERALRMDQGPAAIAHSGRS
jgi:D-sedoheptulose 7-phosphate isomerase